jgi:hypothetical protein
MVREPAELSGGALASLYEAKARAELATAETIVPGSDAVSTHGDPMATVVLVVGEPSEEERHAGRALVGASLDAAAKILGALGLDAASTLAVCSRPSPGAEAEDRRRRLESLVEAADPVFVIALDAAAAQDLAAALHVEPFRAGLAVRARGRVAGWIGDLGASLSDEALKRKVWVAFKSIAAAAGKAADPGV